jgi:hypothetical protein
MTAQQKSKNLGRKRLASVTAEERRLYRELSSALAQYHRLSKSSPPTALRALKLLQGDRSGELGDLAL